MRHYVNSPADDGRKSSGQSKVFRVVGVGFGLLCIVQSTLNVFLRLQGVGFCNKSAHNDSNVTLISTDDNISALNVQLVKENSELQASLDDLARKNEILNDMLNHQHDHIMELQAEKELLMKKLSETEQILQSCPEGWTQYLSSCYQLSTERNSWRYARDDCLVKGAHLVILNDETEKVTLHTLGWYPMWIGLMGTRRSWTWVDGSSLTYHDRIHLQPSGLRNDCAYSKPSTLGAAVWVGAACGEQHHWACEKELK